MATSTIENRMTTVSCSGTTDADGLLQLLNIPSGFYPIYADRYNYVTTFFNGSAMSKQPYVRITNYQGNPIANTTITNLKVVCVGGVISAILSLAHLLTGGRHDKQHRKEIQSRHTKSEQLCSSKHRPCFYYRRYTKWREIYWLGECFVKWLRWLSLYRTPTQQNNKCVGSNWIIIFEQGVLRLLSFRALADRRVVVA